MELIATLLIAGVVLLLLETILPGMIAGIVGFCCLAAAVIMAYSREGVATGNWVLLGTVAFLVLAAAAWIYFFPKSPLARPFLSDRTVGNIGAEQPDLLHQTGVAHTNLRPSGTAVINGRRVDVITEGPMIEKGTAVKVVQVEGMRVVVRAVS